MGDILELRQGFWDDVTVNMDEPDEAIETYASIKQQAELLSERERSYGQFHKLVKLYASGVILPISEESISRKKTGR